MIGHSGVFFCLEPVSWPLGSPSLASAFSPLGWLSCALRAIAVVSGTGWFRGSRNQSNSCVQELRYYDLEFGPSAWGPTERFKLL